jgi:outer membrane protein OmpA-like peptidoglycan-associated protein
LPSHAASSGKRTNLLTAGAIALVLLVSPVVLDNGPALGTSNVDAVVVDVDFTTATQSGSTIVNAASGRLADLTVSGSPTGLTTSNGLTFANAAGGPTNQNITGNIGPTTSMSKIVIEMVAKFPDEGCQVAQSGSMVFSLGVNGSNYVPYNIYRHSGRLGFNTFASELYGIVLPSTTGYHTYKFVLSPNPAAITTQEIWVDGVKQNLAYQSTPAGSGCGGLAGSGPEASSSRVFTGGTGSYSSGDFVLMSHALNVNNWGSTGSIKSFKVTTTAPPPPATTPGAPTISAITAGDTQLSVAFTAPNSNGGASITNYDYSTDNGSNWTTPSPTSTTSPLVITGLTNSTTYTVKIRARNSVGAGTASNGVSGTPAAAPPSPPPSSGSGSSAPPAPPSAEVAGVSVRGGSGNSSVVRITLSKPPAVGEQMFVTVRLLDLNGKVIQELRVPVTSSTSSLEVPVSKGIGQFNAVVATGNASTSSSEVSLTPEIVKAETLGALGNTPSKRLLGKTVPGVLTFLPNSAALSPEVRQALREAALVAKKRDTRIAVTGFAAVSGLGSSFERRIAEQRALAVAKFLRKQGVESWMLYKGLSGAEGQAFPGQPRRVEIRTLK